MADEIVCETEDVYIYEVRRAVSWFPRTPTTPGDSVTVGDKRIVYRPKPPDRCPRCGSSDRNIYIHSSMPPYGFHAPCFNDGDYHPWHAGGFKYAVAHFRDPLGVPHPRDEAREAFEKWLSYDKEQHGVWDTAGMYRAFLAGRASVKP